MLVEGSSMATELDIDLERISFLKSFKFARLSFYSPKPNSDNDIYIAIFNL